MSQDDMRGDATSDALRLIKAFLTIVDAAARAEVIELAERHARAAPDVSLKSH